MITLVMTQMGFIGGAVDVDTAFRQTDPKVVQQRGRVTFLRPPAYYDGVTRKPPDGLLWRVDGSIYGLTVKYPLRGYLYI